MNTLKIPRSDMEQEAYFIIENTNYYISNQLFSIAEEFFKMSDNQLGVY